MYTHISHEHLAILILLFNVVPAELFFSFYLASNSYMVFFKFQSFHVYDTALSSKDALQLTFKYYFAGT